MQRMITAVLALGLAVGATTACSTTGGGLFGASGSAAAPVVTERGVWLSKNEMLLPKEEMLGILDAFADANITSVYVNAQLRGYVMYPDSDILPQWPEMAEHDARILDWLIPAIHERGMRAEAWMEYGFYSYWTPDRSLDSSMGPILDHEPELVSISHTGQPFVENRYGTFYALSPTHPRSQEIMIDMMDEAMSLYEWDGLNLDRIRFNDETFCFAPHSREKFRADTGLEMQPFAAGTEEARILDQWRKDQIHDFMLKLAERMRANHPGKPITAAVMPPYMIDEKGQDWTTWLEAGSLDVAMPMMYLPDITEALDWVVENVGADAPVFHGIDAGNGEARTVQQVLQLQQANAPGVVIWYSGSVRPMLETLANGVFAQPAVSPLAQD